MLRAEVAVHGSSPPALLAGDALSKGAVPAMDDGALGALVASEGGKALLETAKKLFADHNPYAALAAVSKA
ncbi:hypothetical protein PC129_g11169 [Phytophthora cactorum]|uniref:Uncharacterized protein n=1 Tax=Phytophthora cactorum TaxID=29920 RepID=A0A8T1I0X0_9STRA|nr:hypothetical protein PC128_g7032 [Phytophthora cactorum]KAG3218029.1 hypothetical protein PC129_g11169 [Phytophthora cactorum]KAG4242964.1 hypothetical protein PC116_g9143 [Phytophthora cactorum]